MHKTHTFSFLKVFTSILISFIVIITLGGSQQIYATDGKIIDSIDSVDGGTAPSAPTLYTPTASQTSVSLSWSSVSGATGYKVYLAGGALLTTTSSTSYSHTGRTCGTNYSYYVTAYNSYGTSSASNTNGTTTIPCTPSGLSVSNIGQTSATLSWSNVSGEAGYEVRTYGTSPKDDQIGPWIPLGVNTTSYTFTGLICEANYNLQVYAYNASGGSGIASVVVTLPTCTPTAPSGANVITTGDSSLMFTWSDNSSNETGFKIYEYSEIVTKGDNIIPRANAATWVYVTTVSANTTSYYFTGLDCSKTYTYGVRATNAGGDSSMSSDSGTTYTCANAPAYLTSQLTQPTQIAFQWPDATGEIGYGLFRASDGLALDTNIAADSPGYSLGWPYCGATSFYVKAKYQHGTVVWSEPTNTVTETITDPSVCDTTGPTISFNPTSRSWSSSNAVVTVTASDPSSVSYVRHCWTTSASCDPGTSTVNTFSNGGSVTQSSDGSWNLCIRARDSIGNWSSSSCSGTYRVDKTAPTPNAPTITTSDVSQTSAMARISTGTDSLSGLHSTPYGVSINGGAYSWNSLTSQSVSLSCGTTYTLYGKIRDALGNETNAGSTSVTTVVCTPSAPTGVSASAVSQTQINISWNAVSGATGYYVYRDGTQITSTTGTSYSNTGLTCGTNYSYTVRAYNAGGTSGYSTASAATTSSCDTTGPTISFNPTSRSWSSSNASVTVTASDPSGVSATQYCWTTGTSCTPETSFTNGTVLTQSSTGNWKLFIRATDTLSNSATNSSQYYQVDKAAPSPNPPTVSTSSTTQTGTTITVAAGTDADSGLSTTAYGVSTNGSTYSWSSSTSQSVSGLSCGTAYTAYGKIRDAVGNETSAGSTSVTTVVCTPSTPTGVSASAVSQTQINVSWNAVSGATSYLIYRDGGYLTSTTGTSYSNTTGLSCGTSYSYTIRASNAGGTSGYSTASAATTSNCISAPTVLENALNFQVKSGTTNYSATWQDASADGYILYKIDDSTGGIERLGNLTSLSNTGDLSPRCPADYTIGFYAYNMDPTVSTTDPSCSNVQGLDNTGTILPYSGRKCSAIRTMNVDIRHCTQGFLID